MSNSNNDTLELDSPTLAAIGSVAPAVSAASIAALTAALSEPFPADSVKWKPQNISNKGDRAMAVPYVDARAIQDRLDQVVGVGGWQDDYTVLPGESSVVCKLTVDFGGRWVAKMDVGSTSDQPDVGDRMKAAFSDALKRAGVKFGIGRYLYRVPPVWVDYDPQTKKLIEFPALPASALPKGTNPQKKTNTMPVSGAELLQRLQTHEAKLVQRRAIAAGSLLNHVAAAGVRAGYGDKISEWSGPAISFAVEVVRLFEKERAAKAANAAKDATKAG